MTPTTVSEPPLRDGDTMDADEFRRRYEATPDVKAELIEGVVYMASPVNGRFHGLPDDNGGWFLKHSTIPTPGTKSVGNTSVRLGPATEVQPDHVLFVLAEAGGSAGFEDDGNVFGVPDLAWETGASTASHDLGKKLRAYQAAGVREYVVARPLAGTVDWFVLDGGVYRPLPPDPADGLFKSPAFPGLWLDPAAFVADDMAAVLAALTRGLASPEHAAFVARLRSAQGGTP